MMFNGKTLRNYLVSSSAYSLIMWLMRSPKNFEKIANLKIWQPISIWYSKTDFGKTPLKWSNQDCGHLTINHFVSTLTAHTYNQQSLSAKTDATGSTKVV